MTSQPGSRDWPAHTPEIRSWQQSVRRGPKADRDLREIEVRRPPFIGDARFTADRPLRVMMENTLGGIAQLDRTHRGRLGGLNQLLLRTESVASSKIENVEASLADYGRAVMGSAANASAVSMAAATEALSGIIRDVDETGEIRREALHAAHRDLFRHHSSQQHHAGEVRTVQNWIGGSDYSPRNALYVPPPPETVDGYLDDLFVFANRDDVPVIVQAAVVHAQFESIHPFIDGNGRIGRTLIHAVLRRRKTTRNLTVPIASGLVAHREQYFDALGDYRAGYAYTLIAMLTSAMTIATHESRRTASNLLDIRQEWDEALGPVRPGSSVHRILSSLPSRPILTADDAAERLDLATSTVHSAINRLHEAGVLEPTSRRKRDRVWAAQSILDELADLNDRIGALSRTKSRWNV
ncbi:Fic family protein [Aeromicrobium sp. CF4.19]|uniref:Fic family protein n=1 Tax=Aeromicrobium sp. CF4.19 TaxID=3373082 RepID=UPI003EE5FD8A